MNRGALSGGMALPTSSLSRTMFADNFRKAAKGYGTFCPVKNELQIRKGRKIYRFRCEGQSLLFKAPAGQETVLLVAADATVLELRRCFEVMNAPDQLADIG